MIEQKIIMAESPEAATAVQVTMWKDVKGFLHQDERSARYSSSTHHKCDCGGIAEKGWVICKECRQKKDAARYAAMPVVEWNGETPVCLAHSDEFFFDKSSIEDYCEENKIDPADLNLVLCEPQYAPKLKGDFFADYMPSEREDELPDELQSAIDEFNAKVNAYGKPLSWVQSKNRTSCAKESSAPESTSDARLTDS